MARPSWNTRIWQIKSANPAHELLLKRPLPNEFVLLPNHATNPKFYSLQAIGPMSDPWITAILFALGNDDPIGTGVPALDDNSTESDFVNAGRLARGLFEPSQFRNARLVGDIALESHRPGTITLFQVANKVNGNEPLLVMFVDDGTNPGGSAVGRPRPSAP